MSASAAAPKGNSLFPVVVPGFFKPYFCSFSTGSCSGSLYASSFDRDLRERSLLYDGISTVVRDHHWGATAHEEHNSRAMQAFEFEKVRVTWIASRGLASRSNACVLKYEVDSRDGLSLTSEEDLDLKHQKNNKKLRCIGIKAKKGKMASPTAARKSAASKKRDFSLTEEQKQEIKEAFDLRICAKVV